MKKFFGLEFACPPSFLEPVRARIPRPYNLELCPQTFGGNNENTKKVEPATTTTTTVGLCPATKVLASDNPKLGNLRAFRDSTLVKSAVGRKVIQIYYNNAGSINAALDRSPALRAVARKALERIAPMVGMAE